MNGPIATGAAAFGGSQMGPVVIWICTILHMTPPPADVAATIGALLIMAVHQFTASYLSSPTTTTSVPVTTKPITLAVSTTPVTTTETTP